MGAMVQTLVKVLLMRPPPPRPPPVLQDPAGAGGPPGPRRGADGGALRGVPRRPAAVQRGPLGQQPEGHLAAQGQDRGPAHPTHGYARTHTHTHAFIALFIDHNPCKHTCL